MNPLIYRLTLVHRRLEKEIRRELKRRFPDTTRVSRLKKLKLAIKDRLHRHASKIAESFGVNRPLTALPAFADASVPFVGRMPRHMLRICNN